MNLKPKTRMILATISIVGYILITLGFFAVLFFGDTVQFPEGEIGLQLMGMFGMVVGNWSAFTMLVFTFNFGSSQGSKDKSDVQAEMLKGIKNVIP